MATEYTDEQIAMMREFNEATAHKPLPPTEVVGIFENVPEHVYHARQLRTVSKSALDKIDESPAKYHAWVNGLEDEPTDALLFGRALHMAILEPTRFGQVYAVMPSFGDLRRTENKARKLEWEAENAGKEKISAQDERRILGMLESVMKHDAASRLILEGQPEVTLRWKDPITGLACKSRADYWVKSRRYCVDVKSTKSVHPDKFARDAYSFRYHVQDALYRAAFLGCGEPINHFAILAIEKEPPHEPAVYQLDADAVRLGYEAARRDMATLAECIARNEFPWKSNGVQELSLPRWAA